jgi:hypothetical protein
LSAATPNRVVLGSGITAIRGIHSALPATIAGAATVTEANTSYADVFR